MADEENAGGLSSPSRARESAKTGRPTKLTPELGEKVIALIGNGYYLKEACAEVGISPRTLANWRKAAVSGDEELGDIIDAFEVALLKAEGRMQLVHHALAMGRSVPPELKVDLEAVSLHALHFRLERGGNRPFADLKKLELTGKDGERLSGSDVTPAAAAALVRAEFGDQARQQLQADEPADEPTGD